MSTVRKIAGKGGKNHSNAAINAVWKLGKEKGSKMPSYPGRGMRRANFRPMVIAARNRYVERNTKNRSLLRT